MLKIKTREGNFGDQPKQPRLNARQGCGGTRIRCRVEEEDTNSLNSIVG